jgi:hypothetical protein
MEGETFRIHRALLDRDIDSFKTQINGIKSKTDIKKQFSETYDHN